jgi:hypothetical protein
MIIDHVNEEEDEEDRYLAICQVAITNAKTRRENDFSQATFLGLT